MESKSKTESQVITLVELALTRPEGERERYLRSACGANSELFAQAWSYVKWEKRMKGFLLDPVDASAVCERPFQPGELLLHRFRVIREVAQGGMGIVWEAMDEKLDRRVALKCAKAGFGKELPPEVRNAREISHPNVCKIFEIHTTSTPRGDIDFIVMEFLEGETLADRLRRSPVPKPLARDIARQLCAGLSEAHRNDVIHGDLKSNNVILTTAPNGSVRAVITDFGLARRLGNDGWRTAALAGTPAYMAPELWKGASPGIASDIYALGVILWELKSGKKPSELAVTASTLSWEERLAWKPPPGYGKWDRTVARCLDPDPDQRFRNAEGVSRAIAPSRAFGALWALAAVIILMAGSSLTMYERLLAPQESVRLSVLPFTSEANSASLADKLWRDSLAQISRLKGNARTKFSLAPAKEARGRKVNTTDQAVNVLKASHVLHATLTQDHGKAVLHAYLSDTHSGVTIREWVAEYASEETRYAGVALAAFLAESLQLPPLVAHTAVNKQARQDYASGLANLARDSGVDAALAAMTKAVKKDPDSALTHAGLAEAQWRKYFLTKDAVFLGQAKESASRAERRNPDLPEVHRIIGLLYADAGRYEEAITEYKRAIEFDPRNSDGYRRIGLAYKANNQLVEAQTAFKKAIEAQPNYYKAYQHLGSLYFQRGAYGQALTQFRKAVELAPSEPNVRFALANAYLNLGFFNDAERELRQAIRLRERYDSLESLGLVLIYERRELDAIPYLLRASTLDPQALLPWMHLGICYRRTHQMAKAARANRTGLRVGESQLANNPRDSNVRSYVAYMYARIGDRHRAESEIAQALQLSPTDADTRFMAALTYEALGNAQAVTDVLSTSPNEVIADVNRWPDMADLHKNSRFLQLLASRGIK